MRAHYGVVALLAFVACVKEPKEATESVSSALGVVPASETAQWKRVGSTSLPEPRFGQAMALDETRGVLVMFGGIGQSPSAGQSTLSDLWEWDPAAGTWKLRTPTGAAPGARSGAAMAYDATRKKFVLFGGRTGSGYDMQDTWEWDPVTGEWADMTGAGTSPSARSQHGMIFDSKTGKIVLFGGGRSELGQDPMSLYLTFADTWEYDGAHWTQRTPATAPSPRAGFGFAYASSTNKAYLFGGIEIPTNNAPPTLKQDTWEYDGSTGLWAERTATGIKPSARFGHSMAIDSTNGLAVVFGGFDIATSGSKNDVWTWNLSSGAWQGHDAASGALWPGKRRWASLIMGGSASRAFLVGGLLSDSAGYDAGVSAVTGGSREIWELSPSALTWVNRSVPNDSPGPRFSFAMTADLNTGKVYLFGGTDGVGMGNVLNDLWEWNGTKWVECAGETKPPARTGSAMSYDPVRKSLLLFGGNSYGYYSGWEPSMADTWEWNTSTRKWTQLSPAVSPGARSLHAMVTDTARGKVLLYGGQNVTPIIYADGGVKIPTYEIWEWDGAASTWTDRSPYILGEYPNLSAPPAAVYDEGSKKVALFGFNYYGEGNASYWEWDTVTGGLAVHVINDIINVSEVSVTYDSIRRRIVAVGSPANSMTGAPPLSTCELDSAASTWYVRSINDAPIGRWSSGLAFDRQRGVVVLYGGRDPWTAMGLDDTWEYRVGSWGNGTGCTDASASQCASGHCVDGVCCESASCSGACKSCNVPGKAGTCVLATPGTQVVGSCSGDQACDSTGACKTSNGKACTSAAQCASGSCTDGVCCDTACNGECVSCNQQGKIGTCTPFAAGSDPQKECSQGTPPCQSTCDGKGGCFFPSGLSCGSCGYCNGAGTCQEQWYCSVGTGPRTSIFTSVTTNRDGGVGTGTGTAIWTGPSTGTGIATGSRATTGSKTTLVTGTSTATLSQVTVTTTGTGTGPVATAPATNTVTTTRTGTGTLPPTATSAGTAATGTGTASATSPVTGATTATKTSAVTGTGINATGSMTGTSTYASRDGGSGDGGAAKLGHHGCSCDLGTRTAPGSFGPSVLGLLGTLLFLRRRTRKHSKR